MVSRSSARSVLTAKCGYKIKETCAESGALEQVFKAKFVACTFHQGKGTDFEEIFPPAISFPTLTLFLPLAANEDLELHRMDVKTVFLYGDLEQNIILKQPEGFRYESNDELVCKLDKALQDLKQAPRKWYAKKTNFS